MDISFATEHPRLDEIALDIARQHNRKAYLSVLQKYPELINDVNSKSFLDIYRRLNNDILAAKRNFEQIWSKYEADWFSLLRELFPNAESLFPRSSFIAYLGVGTICPRDLNECSFLLPFDSTRMVNIVAHETSHFYFYYYLLANNVGEKNKIFSSKRLWLISEAIVPLIFETERSNKIIGAQPICSYACTKEQIDQLREQFSLVYSNSTDFISILPSLYETTKNWSHRNV